MKKTVDLDLISIIDPNNARHFGADQQWYRHRLHAVSGCGPTTAALITMYMAGAFPQCCAALYPYALPAQKDDFIAHMDDVRQFVKPGPFGLTDPVYFADSTVAFARSKGVALVSQQISPGLSVGVAYGFVKKALDEAYLPALQILRNPSPELDDFTWHWMAVSGYDDEKKTIYISTYAKEYALDFEKVWIQQKPYTASCVYFYPG